MNHQNPHFDQHIQYELNRKKEITNYLLLWRLKLRKNTRISLLSLTVKSVWSTQNDDIAEENDEVKDQRCVGGEQQYDKDYSRMTMQQGRSKSGCVRCDLIKVCKDRMRNLV